MAEKLKRLTCNLSPRSAKVLVKKEIFAPVSTTDEKDGGSNVDEQNKRLLDNLLATRSGKELMDQLKAMFPAIHPVLVTASVGHVTGLKKLLKVVPELINDIRDPQDNSNVLHAVAKSGLSDAAKYLLDSGADPSACNNAGNNPFMVAVSQGCAPLVNVLWNARNAFNINHTNKLGQSALHLAALRGWDSCIHMLIGGGISKNKATLEGCTSLMICAMRGDISTTRRLTSTGANILLEDNEVSTAICLAVKKDQNSVAEHLLDKLSQADLTQYVKRRVQLLSILPDVEETYTFYHDVLYQVFHFLAHHPGSTIRQLLYQHKLIQDWLVAIMRHVSRETVTEKAFMYMADIMCTSTWDGVDARFVEQFLRFGGPDLVLYTMSHYKESSSHEMVACAMLCLLPLAETKAGKKWLEQGYYKISESIEVFQNQHDELEYPNGMKNIAEKLWKKFSEMFSEVQAIQAELHGAELLATEEREKERQKVRREKRREKKRQKRHRAKSVDLNMTSENRNSSDSEEERHPLQKQVTSSRHPGVLDTYSPNAVEMESTSSITSRMTDNSSPWNMRSSAPVHKPKTPQVFVLGTRTSDLPDTTFEIVLPKKKAKEMKKLRHQQEVEKPSENKLSSKIMPLMKTSPTKKRNRNRKSKQTKSVEESVEVTTDTVFNHQNVSYPPETRPILNFPTEQPIMANTVERSSRQALETTFTCVMANTEAMNIQSEPITEVSDPVSYTVRDRSATPENWDTEFTATSTPQKRLNNEADVTNKNNNNTNKKQQENSWNMKKNVTGVVISNMKSSSDPGIYIDMLPTADDIQLRKPYESTSMDSMLLFSAVHEVSSKSIGKSFRCHRRSRSDSTTQQLLREMISIDSSGLSNLSLVLGTSTTMNQHDFISPKKKRVYDNFDSVQTNECAVNGGPQSARDRTATTPPTRELMKTINSQKLCYPAASQDDSHSSASVVLMADLINKSKDKRKDRRCRQRRKKKTQTLQQFLQGDQLADEVSQDIDIQQQAIDAHTREKMSLSSLATEFKQWANISSSLTGHTTHDSDEQHGASFDYVKPSQVTESANYSDDITFSDLSHDAYNEYFITSYDESSFYNFSDMSEYDKSMSHVSEAPEPNDTNNDHEISSSKECDMPTCQDDVFSPLMNNDTSQLMNLHGMLPEVNPTIIDCASRPSVSLCRRPPPGFDFSHVKPQEEQPINYYDYCNQEEQYQNDSYEEVYISDQDTDAIFEDIYENSCFRPIEPFWSPDKHYPTTPEQITPVLDLPEPVSPEFDHLVPDPDVIFDNDPERDCYIMGHVRRDWIGQGYFSSTDKFQQLIESQKELSRHGIEYAGAKFKPLHQHPCDQIAAGRYSGCGDCGVTQVDQIVKTTEADSTAYFWLPSWILDV